jgi:alpha-D-ribose 1-methylphosphonate 5-triphosphate synthase subunit PhnG
VTAPERLSGLAAAARTRRERLLGLGDTIAAGDEAAVLEAPAAAVVPVRLVTAAGELHLVDAVVTTAAVEVRGRRGWACVLGWDDRAALAAALCDALGGAEVTALAAAALEDERARADASAGGVAATRVVPG